MLTIKDFHAGEKVYIFEDASGCINKKEKITETTVKTVGRKYVTTSDYYQSKFGNINAEYLNEVVTCGRSRMLFKTLEDVNEYIEKRELALWLGCMSTVHAEKYSLEQLRKVKEILNEE